MISICGRPESVGESSADSSPQKATVFLIRSHTVAALVRVRARRLPGIVPAFSRRRLRHFKWNWSQRSARMRWSASLRARLGWSWSGVLPGNARGATRSTLVPCGYSMIGTAPDDGRWRLARGFTTGAEGRDLHHVLRVIVNRVQPVLGDVRRRDHLGASADVPTCGVRGARRSGRGGECGARGNGDFRTAVPEVRHRAGDSPRAAREFLRMLQLPQVPGDGTRGIRPR